jgi:carboxyl-terminal processing protease
LALPGPSPRASDAAPAPIDRSEAGTSSASAVADDVLSKALLLERQHRWFDAIQTYQNGLVEWPDRVDFRHRLRLCESHFKLNRRYQDKSFREVLLRLSRDQALDLYDEVQERVELNYVESVSQEPLLRRGYDSLEVALRDPVFLAANAPGQPADRVQWLRSTLQARRQVALARNRGEARAHVLEACEVARQALGIAPTPVILEFCCGAFDALDDYSCYLTPDRLDDLYAMIDGNFVGLGVELKHDPEGLRLVGILSGGPAAEAGFEVGDRITHIDGQSVAGLDLDAAANRLQGVEGSTVNVTLLKKDGSKPSLNLLRRPVEVRSVTEVRMLDPEIGLGYLQLTGFQKTSTEELKTAMASLERQGLKQLVIDLRGNPGGLLPIAVEIADRFLDRGVIVSTRGRSLGQSMVYRAKSDGEWTEPVFVLVDHDSASASEILAGALKENGRATVLGERSYGKGSVQSIFPLRSVPAGLKLTTAKFYSPQDHAFSEQGVEPDVRVATVAKPAEGASGSTAEPDFKPGDPDRDPVLRAAIRMARRR